jgi:hypothetical protein
MHFRIKSLCISYHHHVYLFLAQLRVSSLRRWLVHHGATLVPLALCPPLDDVL